MKYYPQLVLLAIITPIALHFLLVNQFGFPSKLTVHQQFNHLKQITSEMHPFNSAGNIEIQKYLQNSLVEISEKYKSVTLHQDYVNLTTGTNPILFYESSNVIASIKGNSSTAILMSAHYDSMFESYGATDDGVAISAMLSCIEALASQNLRHPIVFLFNNNEESGLVGATAFRSHPLWPTIKTFINLEGTGVAETGRSLLFRANSYKLVERLMKSQTFPHSSIFAATIMKFVKSDTDYRIYLQGGKPGVDMAFYSKRYLYHTELDDFAHVSNKSMAFMFENLRSSLLSLSKDNLVDELESESSDFFTMETSKQTLPVPEYLFYDRFGTIGRAVTNAKYQFQLLSLLIFILLICVLSIVSVFRKSGFKVALQTLIRPSIQAFSYVLATFITTILLLLLTSFIKTEINPGSTYGFAELSMISTYSLVIFVTSTFAELSPVFGDSDRILKKTDEEYSQAQLEANRIISQHDFLQVGVFLFWAFSASLAYFAATKGYTVFFFFYDLSFYSSVGLFLSLILHFVFHRRHAIFTALFANLVPSLYLWDTLDTGLWSLPSFVGEGIPDYGIDCVLGFYVILHVISLMPLFPSSRLVKWSLGSFLTTWILLMTWNPFGKERPVHYGYEEVFNLDQNFTTVDMMVMKTLPAQFILEKWRKEGVDIPDVVVTGHSFTWRNELLPQYGKGDIAINANLKNGVLEGVMTGSPWSRVEPTSIQIDGNWTLQGARGTMESGNTAMILKRDILSGGMKVPFKFVIEAIELVEITVTCHHHIFTASPRFQKLHSQLPDWSIRQLKEKASRSYGDLKLVKKVNISQSKWLGIF